MEVKSLESMELLGSIRVPQVTDAVYKDECMFSHDSPYTVPSGLYISLHSFMAFGRDFVLLDHERSKRTRSVYLNVRKVEKKKDPAAAEDLQKAIHQSAITSTCTRKEDLCCQGWLMSWL